MKLKSGILGMRYVTDTLRRWIERGRNKMVKVKRKCENTENAHQACLNMKKSTRKACEHC